MVAQCRVFCWTVGLLLVSASTLIGATQEDIERARYWRARGYSFNPDVMTSFLMDQKVKDIERAKYWKSKGYDFNPEVMTAFLMDQKVKDIERADYWKAKGYSFIPDVMTAFLMDQKVKDIERARYWSERGYNFNPDVMTSFLMDQKVKDIERAKYWKAKGYDFNPEVMTAYLMDQQVKDLERSGAVVRDDRPVANPPPAIYPRQNIRAGTQYNVMPANPDPPMASPATDVVTITPHEPIQTLPSQPESEVSPGLVRKDLRRLRRPTTAVSAPTSLLTTSSESQNR